MVFDLIADWLPFMVLMLSWMALVVFAEKRKDVVIALISLVVALALLVNPVAREIYVIVDYQIAIIFAAISIYEFFIIAISSRKTAK